MIKDHLDDETVAFREFFKDAVVIEGPQFTIWYHVRAWVRFHILLWNAPIFADFYLAIEFAARNRGKPVRVKGRLKRWYGGVITMQSPKPAE